MKDIVSYPDGGLRHDTQIEHENRSLYRKRRGRKCLYPACYTTVRYTKEVQYCSVHEEFCPKAEYKSQRKGRINPNLLVPGLKTIRLARGLTADALADKVGKGRRWVNRIERGEFGPTKEMRRILAGVLEVEERQLMEAE